MNGTASVEPPAGVHAWAAAGFARELVPVCGPHHRCDSPGKIPHFGGWQTRSFSPDEFGKSWPNLGLRTRLFPAIDIDVEDASVVAAVEDVAREILGTTARRSRRNSARCALLYRLDGAPFSKRRILFDAPDGTRAKIEVLGDGQQLVVDGIHASGAALEWTGSPIDGGSLASMNIEARDGFLSAVRDALEAAGCHNVELDHGERNGERKPAPDPVGPSNANRARKYADGAIAKARRAIEGAKEGERNDELNRQAFGLGQLVAGGVALREVVEAELTAAALRVGLTESETRASIRSGLDAGARDPRGLPPEEPADEPPPPESENPPRPGSTSSTEKRPTIEYVLTSMASVQPKPVRWLWRDRIAFGKITILDGDPGNGKSTIALDLAARLTTGRPMPGEKLPVGPPMRVLLISIEDDPADTLRPRLDAAGANCDLIDTLTIKVKGREVLPVLSDHLVNIEDALEETNAKLLILDPLAALMGRADMFKDQEVRSVLGPLKGVIERHGVANIDIRHFNKSQGGANAIYRGGGSIAIAASARSVLAVARNPQSPIQRVLAVSKGNGAEPQEVPSLAYSMEKVLVGDIETIRIRWEGVVAYTADELLAAQVPESREERGALDEAKDFLLQVLGGGPILSTDLEKQRKAAGVAETTLKRARGALGVKAKYIGGRWLVSLPDRSTATDDPLDPLDESDGSP